MPLWFAKLSMMQPGDAVARPTHGGEIELHGTSFGIGYYAQVEGALEGALDQTLRPVPKGRCWANKRKVRAMMRAHPVRTVCISTIVPSIIIVVVCVSVLPSHSPPSLSPSSPGEQ